MMPVTPKEENADMTAYVGRHKGSPIKEVPQDLYIPPDALELVLDTFQGPLDLLLYIIRKHNIDVLDIPMADLTKQYMGYVEVMRIGQLELAAEYLLMSALLIEIKSRMLLPRPDNPLDEDDDPRASLVKRLIEYEKIKKGAMSLKELPLVDRDFSVAKIFCEKESQEIFPTINVDDLRNAWLGVVARAQTMKNIEVQREELSVRDQMTKILRQLDSDRRVVFEDLFQPFSGIPLLIVTFLAVLELGKERIIQLSQQGIMSPIYIMLRI